MAILAAGTTLRDLWSKAPAEDRYSFQFDGLLETLDPDHDPPGVRLTLPTGGLG
jgi:predicted extracellular nuclease